MLVSQSCQVLRLVSPVISDQEIPIRLSAREVSTLILLRFRFTLILSIDFV